MEVSSRQHFLEGCKTNFYQSIHLTLTTQIPIRLQTGALKYIVSHIKLLVSALRVSDGSLAEPAELLFTCDSI